MNKILKSKEEVQEDDLPSEHGCYVAKVREVWGHVDKFSDLMRKERKYFVKIIQPGRIRSVDYPVIPNKRD